MSSMPKNKLIPVICLFLAASAIMAFQQLSQCDFINYDDDVYVTENIHIRHGITIQAIEDLQTAARFNNEDAKNSLMRLQK